MFCSRLNENSRHGKVHINLLCSFSLTKNVLFDEINYLFPRNHILFLHYFLSDNLQNILYDLLIQQTIVAE